MYSAGGGQWSNNEWRRAAGACGRATGQGRARDPYADGEGDASVVALACSLTHPITSSLYIVILP